MLQRSRNNNNNNVASTPQMVGETRLHSKKKRAYRRWRRALDILFSLLVCVALMTIFRVGSLLPPDPSRDVVVITKRNARRSLWTLDWLASHSRSRRGQKKRYISSPAEEFVLNHVDQLGYSTGNRRNVSGCTIWKDPDVTTKAVHASLQRYRQELAQYAERVRNFHVHEETFADGTKKLSISTTRTPQVQNETAFASWDIRNYLDQGICEKIQLHPDGLPGLFASGELSRISKPNQPQLPPEYVEPLLPPLRHPEMCYTSDSHARKRLMMDPQYLVHDFSSLCRQLTPTSRIVLFDLGASLNYHEGEGLGSPAFYLMRLFSKFGFAFDHIYAFEITPTDTQAVFSYMIPNDLLPSYHWMNVGVDVMQGQKLNPFTMIQKHFAKDDVVIVKLDIDSPLLELHLASQLLNASALDDLVDHFYFEHHVHLEEMAPFWAHTMQGSVKGSLHLFYKIRKRGIPAHYWV